MQKRVTGPPLIGSFEKIRDAKGLTDDETVSWLMKWIRNSAAVIASGDEYAVALYDEYNQQPMDAQPTLTDDEVLAVIDYIRSYEPPVAEGPAATSAGGDAFPSKTILLILAVVLILIALILSRVTNALGRIQAEKEGRKVAPEKPFYQTRKFATLVIIGVTAVFFWWLSTRAIDLQRQQGYEPDQPIWFSHKIHAGINQIDCKYCHVGVERGKQATIPSVNICMNCHRSIRSGPVTGSNELAKVFAAAGYDTIQQTYSLESTGPIEWIRVHNLPDHVYFNHQQHVKVGKIECQTCHGPVEEMDVLKQHAPLSMGWCMDCHRTEDVKVAENRLYYNQHYEHPEGMTVEMIGGTECQKCHY